MGLPAAKSSEGSSIVRAGAGAGVGVGGVGAGCVLCEWGVGSGDLRFVREVSDLLVDLLERLPLLVHTLLGTVRRFLLVLALQLQQIA